MTTTTPDTVVVMTAEMAAMQCDVIAGVKNHAHSYEAGIQFAKALIDIGNGATACYNTATRIDVDKETTARDEEMDEQVMKERDYAEEMVAKLVAEVLGDWPEWSSGYNFPDAFEDVADKLHAERNELTALRTRLATAERRLAAFDETVARGPVAWLLLNQGGLPDDRQDYEEVVLASATDESELAIFLKAGRADPLYALNPEASTDG